MIKKKANKRRSLWTDVWKRMRKNKTAVAGMVTFFIIVVICFSSPLYYSYVDDVLSITTSKQLAPPSRDALFGRDELGRDVLARVIWGGRTTLTITIFAVLFAFICGTILGTTAAYYSRFADTIIMRFLDIIMSVPSILIMICLATVMKPTPGSMIIVVGIGLIPGETRMVRGQVLQVVENEFIESIRLNGASDLKIILFHILPNAISPIITTIILDAAWAVMSISTISFLGLGIQPPDPEWGTIMAGSQKYLRYAWHTVTLPGLALVVTLISLTLVGDGIRDALDPKMKR